MRYVFVAIATSAALVLSCSDEDKSASPKNDDPAPDDRSTANGDGTTATPAPDAEPTPEDVVVELERLYSQAGDRAPVRVRLVPPEGWDKKPDENEWELRKGKSRHSFSLRVTIDTDDEEQLRKLLTKQHDQIETPRKGWDKEVVERDELDDGLLMSLRSTKKESESSHQEVYCAFRRPDDPFVVTLQSISWDEDEQVLAAISETCRSIEIVGASGSD